ncbi:hypothetical protein ACS0TY_009821 [Phlomoides rotata]
MGIIMIIHDDNENFVAYRSLMVSGIYRVDEGETMGLLETLSWLKHMCLPRVKIELDAKMVVDAIRIISGATSVFNDFIAACRRELDELPQLSIHFIYRNANVKTHYIARLARTFPSPNCWVEQL